MLSWRNRLAQDAYTIEVTGSSPVGSTKNKNYEKTTYYSICVTQFNCVCTKANGWIYCY